MLSNCKEHSNLKNNRKNDKRVLMHEIFLKLLIVVVEVMIILIF